MFDTTLGALATSGVLSLGDGYRTKQSELADNGFRIIRVADVKDGRVSLDSPDFVSSAYEKQIGAKRAVAGDVLLTTKGTVGRVAIVPETVSQAVYSPQLCWFRVSNAKVLNSRFLSYWLQSSPFLAQSSYMQGNTDMAPYISLSDLRSAKITLPSAPEQQAIAEVLGALDDKIAHNVAVAAKAWALAETEFTSMQRQPESLKKLGDVSAFEYGRSLPVADRRAGDVVVVGSGGVSGAHNQALVDQPGVVVGRKGSAGSVLWIGGPHFPIDTTFFVRGTSDVYAQQYLYFLLRTLRLDEMNNDSAVPGLNRREALALPVRIPNDAALRRFAAMAETLTSLADGLHRENRTLAATRGALIQALLPGHARARDIETMATGAAP